jgi:DNA-binding NtrC family response regulator
LLEPRAEPAAAAAVSASPRAESEEGLAERVRDFERGLITDALARSGGSRPTAAKILRIPLRTLYRRIQTLGLTVFDEDQAPN